MQADCYVGRTLARQAAYPFGAIARLLMLTGRRREEVVGMTWGELSEDLVTGTIPATRTKNGIRHLVPLSQLELQRAPRSFETLPGRCLG